MAEMKPDKPHIMVEYYYADRPGMYRPEPSESVVSVNQLAGIVFLPQVAGVFFGADSHDRAEQLAFHIASISGLEIVKVFHKQR